MGEFHAEDVQRNNGKEGLDKSWCWRKTDDFVGKGKYRRVTSLGNGNHASAFKLNLFRLAVCSVRLRS